MASGICKSCDRPPQVNPKLCEDCQPWNNLTHFLKCGDPLKALSLDSYQFCDTGQGAQNAAARTPTHTLKDLPYKSPRVYQSRPNCMLCKVLGALLQQYATDSSTGDFQFGPWKPFTVRHSSPATKYHGPEEDSKNKFHSTTEICILPGGIRTSANGSDAYKPIVLKLALHFTDHHFNLESVQPWIPRPALSLPSITRWLSSCTTLHGHECNDFTTPMTSPPGLRLIDTLTRCLTTPTRPVPYQTTQLLLSNLAVLCTPNSLTASVLPPVLSDAIDLCASLSHRYLWIDALCIVQDDPVSKLGQISAMDRIYHMATFTIVALSPDVPGLRGVRPREWQSSTFSAWHGHLDPVFSEAAPPSTSWAVARSRWDTRGWTFQERKLSRRMLLVDEQHAYLSCFRGSFWEGEGRYAEEEDGLTVETGLHVTEGFASYARLVVGYSARKLSFRSDILNAFMGVGNVLGARMETKMLGGLPERWLMQGLMWRGTGRKRDGAGFPSWSWAGWEGVVDYGFAEGRGGGKSALDSFSTWYAPEVGSLVSFFCAEKGEDGAVVVRRVEEGRAWFMESDMWEDEFEECLQYVRDSVRGRPEDVHAAMVQDSWERCIHSPWEGMRHMAITDKARAKAQGVPGSLVFTTTTAMVKLRPADASSTNVVCFDMVDDSHGGDERFVGQTMSMDREWADQTFDLGRKYRVVVLGAGMPNQLRENSRAAWRNCGNGNQFPLALYAMVTEEKGGVLYRLAVGVVELIAWTKMKPVWESVVLG
ncbi:heterokaryon incompatibility protein-domain-containing protein [Podospora conica]|nr:heterokaryon incompatibility protein-domain-containing protein [Schizothecium conicum]